MKTRNGFVSNSSSSSFVLKVGQPFETTLDIAEYMIPKRDWDNDEELVEKVRKLKYNKTPIHALKFNSCNYDTFIAKMGEYFLVETCHNHDWDLYDFNVNRPLEFEEYFGDDSFYELSNKINFYNLEHDVYGRTISYNEEKYTPNNKTYCEKCFSDYWVINNKVVCLVCEKENKNI